MFVNKSLLVIFKFETRTNKLNGQTTTSLVEKGIVSRDEKWWRVPHALQGLFIFPENLIPSFLFALDSDSCLFNFPVEFCNNIVSKTITYLPVRSQESKSQLTRGILVFNAPLWIAIEMPDLGFTRKTAVDITRWLPNHMIMLRWAFMQPVSTAGSHANTVPHVTYFRILMMLNMALRRKHIHSLKHAE